MVKYIFTFFRRLKFNVKYLYSTSLQVPINLEAYTYRNPKYFHKILDYLDQADIDEENLLQVIKRYIVFGKEIDQENFTIDIFNGYDFKSKKKKFKPAYFNVADVKVPYEIGRLQGLQKNNFIAQEKAIFPEDTLGIDTLPTILWNSPMDVAIRNINLIFHRNFNCDIHQQIISNSQKEIEAYIGQHYKYIKNNLENFGNVVGNHYLVELTSLLLTIATFEFDSCQDDFDYLTKELAKQLDKQFYQDGTSFEGSSHYAAFATEALLLCKLAIEEIDHGSPILQKIERIVRANRLFLSTLIVNGELSQIGDNDSGRLFYFEYNEYQPLNMKWLINLIDFIFPDISNEFNHSNLSPKERNKNLIDLTDYKKVIHSPIHVFNKEFELYAFRDFGIYVWRNENEYFSIRCGQIGQNSVGGHSHYDQLAIECFTDNKWIARDPGTGTYTDDIEVRNNFRSMEYHWGPKAVLKFSKEDEFDCFKLNNISNGIVLEVGNNSFLGYADFNRSRIYRKIRIEDGIVYIEDFSNDVELEGYTSWGEDKEGIKVQFSEGYKRVT